MELWTGNSSGLQNNLRCHGNLALLVFCIIEKLPMLNIWKWRQKFITGLILSLSETKDRTLILCLGKRIFMRWFLVTPPPPLTNVYSLWTVHDSNLKAYCIILHATTLYHYIAALWKLNAGFNGQLYKFCLYWIILSRKMILEWFMVLIVVLKGNLSVMCY